MDHYESITALNILESAYIKGRLRPEKKKKKKQLVNFCLSKVCLVQSCNWKKKDAANNSGLTIS